jgi:hypothetical protein
MFPRLLSVGPKMAGAPPIKNSTSFFLLHFGHLALFRSSNLQSTSKLAVHFLQRKQYVGMVHHLYKNCLRFCTKIDTANYLV